MAPIESTSESASKLSTVNLWVIAVLAAILAFVVGVMMKGLAYKGVGPNVFQTWIFATILAAFVGILIAPPQHRKAARYIFIAMPVALSAVLILDNFVEHTVNVANEFEEIAGSVMGGLIVWRINRGQWRP